MKRIVVLFAIVALVLVSTGIWFFSAGGNSGLVENLHFVVILALVLFAVYIGYRRLTSVRRREPAEDELSKKVLQKTAALSYYISLYLWVFMIYLKDRVEMDTEVLLGSGILGMAVIFALCWFFFNWRGVRNE